MIPQPYHHDAIVSALTQSTVHVQKLDHKREAMLWTLTFGQRLLSHSGRQPTVGLISKMVTTVQYGCCLDLNIFSAPLKFSASPHATSKWPEQSVS